MGSKFNIGSDTVSQRGLDEVGQIAIFFNCTIANGMQKIWIDTNGNGDLHMRCSGVC